MSFWALTTGVYDMVNAADSKSWPIAKGVVLSSKIKQVGGQTRGYVPNVEYLYKIRGREYRGDTVTYGESKGSKREARERANRYPKDAVVSVYHDPDNPYLSVLEPGGASNVWPKIFFGMFAFFAGIVAWRHVN